MHIKYQIYDNEGKSFDQYTVVFMKERHRDGTYNCLGMSKNPESLLGFCQHSTAVVGDHLGKRIRLEDLPEACQEKLRTIIN